MTDAMLNVCRIREMTLSLSQLRIKRESEVPRELKRTARPEQERQLQQELMAHCGGTARAYSELLSEAIAAIADQ